MRPLKIADCAVVIILLDYPIGWAPYVDDQVRYNWNARSAVEVIQKMKDLLLFFFQIVGIVLKCALHMPHASFF